MSDLAELERRVAALTARRDALRARARQRERADDLRRKVLLAPVSCAGGRTVGCRGNGDGCSTTTWPGHATAGCSGSMCLKSENRRTAESHPAA